MPNPRRRLVGPRIHLCHGYQPGATPLVAPPATTAGCEPHTPRPEGYTQASEWAETMAATHVQRQCAGCGFWLIWEPAPGESPQAPALL